MLIKPMVLCPTLDSRHSTKLLVMLGPPTNLVEGRLRESTALALLCLYITSLALMSKVTQLVDRPEQFPELKLLLVISNQVI